MAKILFSVQIQAVLFVLLLFSGACLYLFGIQSETQMLADQTGTVDTNQLALKRTQNQKEKYQNLVDRVAANQKTIQQFRQSTLRQKDDRVLALSALLSDLAKKHSIQLDQVRYTSQPIANQNMGLYRIDFPAQGTYSRIRAFIGDLEASDQFVMMTQLQMETSEQFQSSVRAQFRLATFFEEQP